jgi:2-oxoglutarate ferredoxin oxidoreductase subunit alpha
MRFEFIDGAEAICRGALYAGADFFAGYPITPATGILIKMMQELPRRGGVAIQGEDEIASISMCLGAAMTGKKVFTATSGPGMSLYSETLGMAILGEVPMVIVDVQRLGPSTGGATTGAQGDVQFSRWVAPGGIPMVVLCPSSVESLITLTVKAFNIAELLRVPVILLTQKDMVLSTHTLDRDKLVMPEVVGRKTYDGPGPFVPYAVPSPGAVPAFAPVGGQHLTRFTGSMHNVTGHLTKVPEDIEAKQRHLVAKILENRHLIETVDLDLEEGADTLLMAHGVNGPVCHETVAEVRRRGGRCSGMVVESLYPEPIDALQRALKGIRKVVLPEMNLGQYALSIRALLPHDVELVEVHKIDGDLISVSEVISRGGLL